MSVRESNMFVWEMQHVDVVCVEKSGDLSKVMPMKIGRLKSNFNFGGV